MSLTIGLLFEHTVLLELMGGPLARSPSKSSRADATIYSMYVQKQLPE